MSEVRAELTALVMPGHILNDSAKKRYGELWSAGAQFTGLS